MKEFEQKIYMTVVLLCKKIWQIFRWNGEQKGHFENFQPVLTDFVQLIAYINTGYLSSTIASIAWAKYAT